MTGTLDCILDSLDNVKLSLEGGFQSTDDNYIRLGNALSR